MTFGMQCASSSLALAMAGDMIRSGDESRVVVGGYDLVEPLGYYLLRQTGLADAGVADPFGAGHAGFNVADGAAMIVLESERAVSARRARCRGELRGWAVACHPSEGEPSVPATCRAIEDSLRDAGVTADDVDLISPHGCGIPALDRCESLALRRVFGRRLEEIPIAVYAGYTGYTFAASGLIDLVFALDAMKHGRVLPGSGPETPDPVSDFRFVTRAPLAGRFHHALKLKLAYSGAVGSVIVSSHAA
jgi:3-oxoacyl-(acyl-carrier-protein) synthase